MLVRWLGGKSKLAEEIVNIFPPHKRYIEPFFGGGWIFFKKAPTDESILNDINSDLMNLYLTVRDEPQELARLIHYTPKHESIFNQYIDLYWNKREVYSRLSNPVRAMIYLFLVKNSFNAMFYSFSVGSTGWQGDGITETMWKVHEKLKGANILCRDYGEVIRQYANKDTLIYLDPPYAITMDEKDYYYKYTLTEKQHEQLRNELVGRKDVYKWVLSYDIHPLIEKLYSNIPNIYIMKTTMQFQASINRSNVTSKEYDKTNKFRQEYLITNFPIQSTLPLFGGIE